MPPADGTAKPPSQRWLDATLWERAPSTAHLKKFRPRVRAAVPAALLDAFASIETIRIAGLPDGAEVVDGTPAEPGAWNISTETARDFAIIGPAGSDGAEVNLSLEVTGQETAAGETVSMLGGIAVTLPKTRQGPLFANLPDMRWARERQEAEKQAAAKVAEAQTAQAAPAPKPNAGVTVPDKPAEKPTPNPVAKTTVTTTDKPPPKPPAKTVPLKPAEPPTQKPVPEAASNPVAKPRPRQTVALKPAPRATAKPAPPDAKAAPGAKPKTEPKPARPRKSAAVWSKPLHPAAKAAAPKASAKPSVSKAPAKPAVAKAPVKPAISKAPAKPALSKAPAKSGASWSRPPSKTVPAVAPAPLQGGITIELGGAPEVGDPHFRVFIDGAQVLDGNIDWGLGLPATDGDEDGLCWQTREIPWDFTAGAPDEIALRYDNGDAGESAAGTLLARAVDVGGKRIDAEGPHARYPDGRHAWAGVDGQGGEGEQRSWVGALVFDVAAALGGTSADSDGSESGMLPPTSPDAGSSAAITATPESGHTLVLRPEAGDLANPAVLAAFAQLRARLRGADAPDDGLLPELLGPLNFDAGKWSDLLVLDADGNSIAIGDAPPPLLADAPPQFSPADVQAAIDRLEAPAGSLINPDVGSFVEDLLAPPDIAPAMSAPAIPVPAGSPGTDLRDVFLAERLVRARSMRFDAVRADHDAAEAAPGTVRDWLPVPASEGVRVRESFLTAWAIRGDTHALLPAQHPLAPPPGRALDQAMAPSAHPGRSAGIGVSQDFLTHHLKHALEMLHPPTAHRHGESSPAPIPSTPATVPGQSISGSFLDELVDRAKARIAPVGA